jgi:hypothetical protein
MKLLFVLLFIAITFISGGSHVSLAYNLSLLCFALSVYILSAVATFLVRPTDVNGRIIRLVTFLGLFIVADVARYFYLPTLTEAEIPLIQDIVFLLFSLICLGGLIVIQRAQNSSVVLSSIYVTLFSWALSVPVLIFIGFKVLLPTFETNLLQVSGGYFNEISSIDKSQPTALSELRIKNDTSIMLEYPLEQTCVGVYSNRDKTMIWVPRATDYFPSGTQWFEPIQGSLDRSTFDSDIAGTGRGFWYEPSYPVLLLKVPPHSDMSLKIGAQLGVGDLAPHMQLSNEIQIYKNTGDACGRTQTPLLKTVKFVGTWM